MNWEVWVMNLKTSSSEKLFSKAIIKADLKNHWGWPVIAGVLMLFNLFTLLDSSYLMSYFERVDTDVRWTVMAEQLLNYYYFTFFVGIAFAILLGAKLFFYLDKVNSVSCMHGMPFTRKKLFFSHLASGAILILLPAAFITAAMILLKAALPYSIFRIDICLAFLLVYAVYAFIAFAISVFTMTISGNVVISLAYCGCIVALPISIVAFIEFLCEEQLYGYVSGGIVEKVFEYLYILPHDILPGKLFIYIIVGTMLFVAAYFIYKIRPLENCEEVMAFRKTRWLFIALVGLVLGMISYCFFVGILNAESILFMLPLGLVGTIAANMFAAKSLSLKGSFKYAGAYVLLVLICAGGFQYDLFGYERRVPSSAAIDSVYVEYDSRNFYYYEYEGKMPDYYITDPDEIELVRDLHKAYVSERGNTYTYKNYNNAMYRNDDAMIVYKLKNGMTMKRRYKYLSVENFDKYLSPVLNTEIMKSRKYPVNDGVEKEILSITMYDNRIKIPAVTYTKTEDVEKLYAAVKKDVENCSYSELFGSGALHLTIEFYVPGSRHHGGELPQNTSEKYTVNSSFSVRINNNFKETLRALEEIGYEIDLREDIEKIDKLTIEAYETQKYLNYAAGYEYATKDLVGSVLGYYPEDSMAYERGNVQITITDKEDIEAFYKLCGTGFIDDMTVSEEINVRECVFVFREIDEETGAENVIYDCGEELIVEKLPENLRKYFR
jgi:ABC-2 type transport system permease protein